MHDHIIYEYRRALKIHRLRLRKEADKLMEIEGKGRAEAITKAAEMRTVADYIVRLPFPISESAFRASNPKYVSPEDVKGVSVRKFGGEENPMIKLRNDLGG